MPAKTATFAQVDLRKYTWLTQLCEMHISNVRFEIFLKDYGVCQNYTLSFRVLPLLINIGFNRVSVEFNTDPPRSVFTGAWHKWGRKIKDGLNPQSHSSPGHRWLWRTTYLDISYQKYIRARSLEELVADEPPN